MTLSVETQQKIKAMVRGGFEEHDRIVEIFCEEMYPATPRATGMRM